MKEKKAVTPKMYLSTYTDNGEQSWTVIYQAAPLMASQNGDNGKASAYAIYAAQQQRELALPVKPPVWDGNKGKFIELDSGTEG